jgi:hypothetical protein
MLIGGLMGHRYGRQRYSNPKVQRTIKRIKAYLRELKKEKAQK